MGPNPLLLGWKPKRFAKGPNLRALVVGCGYSDDAEWLTTQGFAVTAFDVSSTAIA
ncbi:MAG: SAM-dependent methyltransferase, partial [Thermoplasmata archaeon]